MLVELALQYMTKLNQLVNCNCISNLSPYRQLGSSCFSMLAFFSLWYFFRVLRMILSSSWIVLSSVTTVSHSLFFGVTVVLSETSFRHLRKSSFFVGDQVLTRTPMLASSRFAHSLRVFTMSCSVMKR